MFCRSNKLVKQFVVAVVGIVVVVVVMVVVVAMAISSRDSIINSFVCGTLTEIAHCNNKYNSSSNSISKRK